MYSPVDDPEKKRLLRKAAAHREELETEFEELTRRTEKILTHALIIGGAIALSYLLVRQFAGGKPRKKSKQQKEETPPVQQPEEKSAFADFLTQAGTVLASQAAVFLLSIAKEKLLTYLRQSSNSANDAHSKPTA
jgi:putative copper export protein